MRTAAVVLLALLAAPALAQDKPKPARKQPNQGTPKPAGQQEDTAEETKGGKTGPNQAKPGAKRARKRTGSRARPQRTPRPSKQTPQPEVKPQEQEEDDKSAVQIPPDVQKKIDEMFQPEESGQDTKRKARPRRSPSRSGWWPRSGCPRTRRAPGARRCSPS